jgi:hypothetical protein
MELQSTEVKTGPFGLYTKRYILEQEQNFTSPLHDEFYLKKLPYTGMYS